MIKRATLSLRRVLRSNGWSVSLRPALARHCKRNVNVDSRIHSSIWSRCIRNAARTILVTSYPGHSDRRSFAVSVKTPIFVVSNEREIVRISRNRESAHRPDEHIRVKEFFRNKMQTREIPLFPTLLRGRESGALYLFPRTMPADFFAAKDIYMFISTLLDSGEHSRESQVFLAAALT